MGPLPIDWVELSNHARTRIANIDGVDNDLVVGRIKHGHCSFYREEPGEYDAFLDDHSVAAHFVIHIDGIEKRAVVKTVFEVNGGPGSRYAGDRFEYVG